LLKSANAATPWVGDSDVLTESGKSLRVHVGMVEDAAERCPPGTTGLAVVPTEVRQG